MTNNTFGYIIESYSVDLQDNKMSEKVELYCTYDEDDCKWLVWFPHPLTGMNVLDSFDNESDARAFLQDQLDNADYSA